MKYLLIAFVRLWRAVVSPSYGPVCKYHPSCSAYALRALETRGAVVGTLLAAWRLLRCNPWSMGGYDPVPGTPEYAAWRDEQATAPAADTRPATGGTPPSPERPDLATSGSVHHTRGEI